MANSGPASTVSTNLVTVIGPSNTITVPASTGSVAGVQRLLASVRGANLNATGDSIMPVVNISTNFVVTMILFANCNAGGSMNAWGGVFAGPGATQTISPNALLTGLTGLSFVYIRQLPNSLSQLNVVAGPYLYFNVGTPQGSAATIDVFAYGYDLP